MVKHRELFQHIPQHLVSSQLVDILQLFGKEEKEAGKKKSVGGKRFLPCSDCIYFLIEIVKIQSKIYFLQVRELLLTAFPEFLSLKKKKKGKRRC